MKTHISLLILFFLSITVLSAQKKPKDTLFFKLDNNYVYESKYEPKSFLIKNSNGSEILFFKRIETVKNSKPNEILSLKKIICSTKFYDKNKN